MSTSPPVRPPSVLVDSQNAATSPYWFAHKRTRTSLAERSSLAVEFSTPEPLMPEPETRFLVKRMS